MKREVVEQLIREHDPFDLFPNRLERRSEGDGKFGERLPSASASVDGDVLERQVPKLGEKLPSEGAVACADFDQREGLGSVECLPGLADRDGETGGEGGIDVRAGDEVPALPHRRAVVEPSGRVQRELHELRERDRPVVGDRRADPVPNGRLVGHVGRG